ncbi:MAG: mechanosensitive ion channel protein MscS [Desulfobulbus propionicus]|nr:MAG: mechanosensitive ion channel protein MscS [Desulfobulbus propionicus]
MSFFNKLDSKLEALFGTAPFGATWQNHINATLVMLAALLLFALARPVANHIARRGNHHHRSAIGKAVVDAVVPPLRLVPLIIGLYAALHILHLSGKPSELADNFMISGVIALSSWALARLASRSEAIWDKLNLGLEISIQRWLSIAIWLLVLTSGGAIILEVWGIPVAPLIGSLGVFGIAVGLAAKDLFSNLISGLLIMTEKRFTPGDWIKVEGVVEGTVEQIDFRSTRIRRFDLSPVYVPNSVLSDNAMTNFSRMTYRRIYWTVGLDYATPPKALEQIRVEVENWLQEDERICQPPKASLFVRIDSFGDSAINLMIYCFTRTTAWDNWLKIKEDFALALIPIVKNTGAGFAFPSRSVYLTQIDPPEDVTPVREATGSYQSK